MLTCPYFGSSCLQTIGGEIYLSITYVPFETTKQYTAYAPDKHPEAETVKIKIYSDMK